MAKIFIFSSVIFLGTTHAHRSASLLAAIAATAIAATHATSLSSSFADLKSLMLAVARAFALTIVEQGAFVAPSGQLLRPSLPLCTNSD
ncbi:hypothetical protein DFH06DRAFT_1350678 [Mycena polygramma]|nr:hypothetical protein DFH06DRAFT_1350678 [Mycena polygramma]